MQTVTFLLALFIFLFSPVLLVVAMIAPNWVNKQLKREFSRKEYIRNLLIATVVALGIAIFAAPASTTPPQSAAQVAIPSPEVVITEDVSAPQVSPVPASGEIESAVTPIPSPSPSPSLTPIPTPKPSSTVKPTPVPTLKPVVVTTPKPPQTPAPVNNGGGFSCNCSKTCPNMSCAEAQYQLNSCGCSARDGDHDGVACDSQCQ